MRCLSSSIFLPSVLHRILSYTLVLFFSLVPFTLRPFFYILVTRLSFFPFDFFLIFISILRGEKYSSLSSSLFPSSFYPGFFLSVPISFLRDGNTFLFFSLTSFHLFLLCCSSVSADELYQATAFISYFPVERHSLGLQLYS